MKLEEDYREFLVLLETYKVQYMVVGGYAIAFHGYPKFTDNIDVWINPTNENKGKLMEVLEQFGFDSSPFQEMDFQNEEVAFYLGDPPIRIAIMNGIAGLKFEEASLNAKVFHIDELNVKFISKDDLIKNKVASGMLRDLDDIGNLQ